MEPALLVALAVATVSGFGWMMTVVGRRLRSARQPSLRVAGCIGAAAIFGAAVFPPVALAEVVPPIVRLAEQHAARNATSSTAPALVYEVVKGDSLWRIADRILAERNGEEPSSREVALFWPRIYAANRAVVGDNPCLIFPGQRFEIPDA